MPRDAWAVPAPPPVVRRTPRRSLRARVLAGIAHRERHAIDAGPASGCPFLCQLAEAPGATRAGIGDQERPCGLDLRCRSCKLPAIVVAKWHIGKYAGSRDSPGSNFRYGRFRPQYAVRGKCRTAPSEYDPSPGRFGVYHQRRARAWRYAASSDPQNKTTGATTVKSMDRWVTRPRLWAREWKPAHRSPERAASRVELEKAVHFGRAV
jgi:hypothetical protein